MPKDAPYKAIAAFVLTTLGLVVQALVGRGDSAISPREWFVIVVGAIVTAGSVYVIDNRRT